jgi:NAD(P)-dependent dehydrogenase (short-subunit alcohol dehydrogenase family)
LAKEQAKVALVTGANRGIGFAIAKGLAQYGLTVLAGVRTAEKGDGAASAFRKAGVDVVPVVVDVAEAARIPEMFREIESRHGAIDVLVNNAAIQIDSAGFSGSLLDMADETVRQTFETNVVGPAATIKALMPGMLARGYGRIVNISSRAGQLSGMSRGFPAYRISKTALNALTLIAAAEAGRGDIKVNACSPGWVRTDMGGSNAQRSPEEGAETAIWLATLDANGPTGGFFEDKRQIPW